jgi:UDP-glucose 4-epimerase
MSCVLRGEPMPVFGDGRQTRAFSHIDDVAPVIARSVIEPGAVNEIFNVGADRPYSVLELSEEVATAFGVPCRVTHLPARNEVVHAFSDHSKVRAVFGDAAMVELPEGISRMAEWVKAVGVRPPVTFAGAMELDRNLPPSWAR